VLFRKRKKLLSIMAALTLTISILSPAASAQGIQISDQGQMYWRAPENSPIVTIAGDLVRVDYIHYANNTIGTTTRPAKSSPGYKLLGVKWITPEGYSINSVSIPIVNKDEAVKALEASNQTWDNNTEADLFLDEAIKIDNNAVYGTYDGTNTIDFGALDYPNAIAVTSIWYSRRTKAILEYDIRFSTAFFWSTNGDPDKMDIQNIATHEFGHAVGLDDIYISSYSEITMYGYAAEGETKKQTLDPSDITGLHKMYGE
jgi:hypothetical protein